MPGSITMLRNEFEEILIVETPYYQRLKMIYREVTRYKRDLQILEKLFPGDPLLKFFSQKEGRELVFLGRKIFALQTEFIQNYLQFLRDESLTRWEQFFERYSNNLFEIYKKFIEGDGNRVFIFEIVNRKLLRDILTKETAGMGIDEKSLSVERIGIVVNQLFNYIRNSLARGVITVSSPILDSYGKIPLLPRCGRNEMIKLLNKTILKNGLPEPVFSALMKFVITSRYQEDFKGITEEIEKLGVLLTRERIIEILNSHFCLPDETSFERISDFIQTRAQGAIEALEIKIASIEKEIKDLETRIPSEYKVLGEELISIAQNLTTEESIDIRLKKIKRNLLSFAYDLKRLKREYQEYCEQKSELEGITKLKSSKFVQFIKKEEWETFLSLFIGERRLNLSEEQFQSLMKETINEIKNERSAMEIINELKTPGLFKERYNYEEVTRRFDKIIEEVIRPLTISFLLEELIEYYPKVGVKPEMENIRYLAEEAVSGKVSLIEKEIKPKPLPETPPPLNIHRYKNLVSVLVYDIRGSTFMGTKLKNALKESEIRNLFQETMLTVVEKYGGLPIKDTGDGGIIFFARNNYAIKKGETIIPEPGSVLDAVRCGLEMTKEAMSFVQENINRYKDWFQEAEERKIDFEGATYATLPPSYQAIFQIGVGIASGEYPGEVYLDKNAFGDPDLTGMLVREANFYAKIKSKEKSTVVCDDSTVYNLLLNIEKFSFLSDAGWRMDSLFLDIEQGLEYWINQKVTRRGFILDFYKILLSRLGEEVIHPGHIRILLGVSDIVINESGEIRDGKGGRGKYIFEVSQEAIK